MKSLSVLILAQICVAPLAAQTDVRVNAPSSRYTEFGRCTEFIQGDVEAGEDWVSHKCEGYDDTPLWLTFMDSARSYLGFGNRENFSGPFGLSREESWPLEWRGVAHGGRFVPFAVIVRMNRPAVGMPGDGTGYLFVFRLRSDETSCMLASDLTSNEAAQAIADGSRETYECLYEPYIPR